MGIEKNNLSLTNNSEDDLCSMNIFALFPETLKLLKEKLNLFKEKNKGNRIAECFLPDEISNLIKEGKIKMKIYPATEKWIGVTYPEDEEKVRNILLKS